MTNDELKEIRERLGLSINELAKITGVRPDYLRHMEMSPDRKSARPISGPYERLVLAYVEGYRPKDWPFITKDWEEEWKKFFTRHS